MKKLIKNNIIILTLAVAPISAFATDAPLTPDLFYDTVKNFETCTQTYDWENYNCNQFADSFKCEADAAGIGDSVHVAYIYPHATDEDLGASDPDCYGHSLNIYATQTPEQACEGTVTYCFFEPQRLPGEENQGFTNHCWDQEAGSGPAIPQDVCESVYWQYWDSGQCGWAAFLGGPSCGVM